MTCRTLGRTAAALALLAVAGCQTIGSPLDVIATKSDAPDEFQVLPRAPLRMPASLALPEPRPGAPSPLDPNPGRDAAVALLGTDAVPAAAGVSAGEQALLSAANASVADPEIRRTIAAEAVAEDENRPYEPPFFWELFGGRSGRPHEDAIDPAAEARRLQSEGVAAAPIDPADRPPGEDAPEVEEGLPAYPELGTPGPPRNKLPSSRVVPVFE